MQIFFNIDVIGLQVLQVGDAEAQTCRVDSKVIFVFVFWLSPMTRSMWDPQEPQPLQRKLGVLTTGLPGN